MGKINTQNSVQPSSGENEWSFDMQLVHGDWPGQLPESLGNLVLSAKKVVVDVLDGTGLSERLKEETSYTSYLKDSIYRYVSVKYLLLWTGGGTQKVYPKIRLIRCRFCLVTSFSTESSLSIWKKNWIMTGWRQMMWGLWYPNALSILSINMKKNILQFSLASTIDQMVDGRD